MAEPTTLGTFIRSRRERVAPADVGLPESGRRRTPGLRREELAMLANISADYLVRLEQGRERSPSSSVLASLADVLGLNDEERRHMGKMALVTSQDEMCPATAGPAPLPPNTLALLDRLDPTPAVVVDASTDLLAWNPAYETLMRPTGVLDPEPPNLLRFTFLSPAARSLYRDWRAVAREQVASLRAATSRCTVVRTLESLVGELSVQSPEFARLWARHDVGDRRRGVDRLAHPVAGLLDLAFESLVLPDPRERRLLTYLPADQAAADALERVLAPTGQIPLRLVGGGAA